MSVLRAIGSPYRMICPDGCRSSTFHFGALLMEASEGPCLEAAYEHSTIRVPDMSVEQRWLPFAQCATEAGACGMLSLQLWVEGDDLGALNLYSHEANAFTGESENIGLLLASHAAVAFAEG